MNQNTLRRSALSASIAGVLLAMAVLPTRCFAAGLPFADAEEVGMDAQRLERIGPLVAEGLRKNRMPGCVVLVARQGRIVFLRSYGVRQRKPETAPMTTDTLFDMASITKPVATATSILKLVEDGKVALDQPVAKYLPDFAQNGKGAITIRQLLTHQGGLIPDNSIKDYSQGAEVAWQKIFALKPIAAPNEKFIYSDVGFQVLAKVIEAVSGQDVNAFSRRHLFQPLGLTETGYLPNETLRKRAAVTQQRNGRWMRGEVHDPRAFALGGVAGHAGLFSTAQDLAVFSQMLLQQGVYRGTRILQPQTVRLMTSPQRVSSGWRALGWDMHTGYSYNRGDLLSPHAFGHGGFTGTVLWIDPELELTFIFLSNRVHPDGKGSVNRLAGRIATLAAAAINENPPPRRQPSSSLHAAPLPNAILPSGAALTGIDVLVRNEFEALRKQRVGLITNHTGVSRDGATTAELLHASPHVQLAALLSPEHGIQGKLDVSHIADGRDAQTAAPIFSLYGKTRRPTAKMLEGIDTLVFDIQDIGSRFYTYISTLGEAMQAAAEHGVRFVVLDRPNPIGGVAVSGPVLDAGRESFVSFHRLPVRHGMTVGELAKMFKAELHLDLDLHIVRVQGWRREQMHDATGLTWINPSPNMRSLTQALLYPGVGLLETTNLSVGRGTDTPFEIVGAPWLEGPKLAALLNRAGLPGVRFIPIHFTPKASKFAEQRCGGVNILVTERRRFQPVRTGLEIARCLRILYPQQWEAEKCDRLLRHQATLDLLLEGRSFAEMRAAYAAELVEFLGRRQRYLLY